MINAVLVFNNSGQPRLTKFYTQLVSKPERTRAAQVEYSDEGTGYKRSTAPDLGDFHSRLEPSKLVLQFFAVSLRQVADQSYNIKLIGTWSSLPPLLASSGTSMSPSTPHNDRPSLVTYRHYATLYFIIISTSTESPLALLDLIQVFVEALDRLFENVCELDLIFNFETLHATLSEMIVGGVVVETGLDRVVEGVRSQGRVAKRPVTEGKSIGIGGLGSFGRGEGVWSGR